MMIYILLPLGPFAVFLIIIKVAPKYNSLRSSQVNLNYAFEQCRRMFGLEEKPKTAEVNARYGGAKPVQASRIFFSDFSDDPWQQVRHIIPPLR